MAGFYLSVSAKEDMLAIARYTQRQWGVAQRNDYLRMLDGAFHRLAEMPELGAQCDFIRPGYRKHPVGSHLIFYRLDAQHVLEVVRVLHQMMDVCKAHLSGEG